MKTKAILTLSLVILITISIIIYINYPAINREQTDPLLNLIDDTGYLTTLNTYPNKIISLAPSTTEILFALGLDDKVVAVSDYCNYPHNFSAMIAEGRIKSIGDFSNPNIEVIASLQPDLILATAGVQEETIA